MSGFEHNELVDLRGKLFDAKQRLAVATTEVKFLEAKISEVLAPTAAQLFERDSKLSGDITFETDAGKFKASISKTVKWDSGKLQALAAQMPWQEALAVFKIDFTVSEAAFKAAQQMRPDLAEKLVEARTTKYGDLKVVAIDPDTKE